MFESVESSELLERVSGAIRRPIAGLLEGKRFRDALSGSWLGHPVHPTLVAVPLGMWSAALVADIAGDPETARRLTAVGVAAVVPASVTGLSDWLDTAGVEQRVGVVHMAANVAATGLMSAGWLARRVGRRRAGSMLGAAGLVVAAGGGWLGGHLAYGLGVGVDTNAFDGGPTEWTDLTVETSGEKSSGVRAGYAEGVGMVVIDADEGGGPRAVLANRCSHRGGPLAEGEVHGSCVRCPWHGSQFDIATGAVTRGPAAVAQPAYQLRRRGAGWQVRRDEPRALRTNSV
ncbi:MAG: Rieske (2Fe-2S) protein [Acidimicrobiales bacterium]|nr:Rieske (2Fe-2S) protein [Acidimicrobiales bacterium]